MVSLYMRWLGVLEEAGPMLELIEEDRGMGTWRQGQAAKVDSHLGMSFLKTASCIWGQSWTESQ